MNWILLYAPLVVTSLCAVVFREEKKIKIANYVLATLGGSWIIFNLVPFIFAENNKLISAWWQVDSFAALMGTLIAILYISTVVVSIRYIGHEYQEKIITLNYYRLYFFLLHWFVLSMLVTVLTNNTLLLWLALEGTTLFSTFLVGLYRKKASVEAAWKYMIICSTGISLGLVGILLLSYGVHIKGEISSGEIFLLSSLVEGAKFIPVEIVKLAFIFIFIGFGVKVGLVPMHTWLPDAHSKAPSPISAIFSGILLNVALYAILRFKFVSDTALGSAEWSNHLFLLFGVFSIVFPTFMMLIQINYKRMLAYSSIEHLGLMAIAMSLSPIGIMAGIIHMIGHTFIKSALFFTAGEIIIKWKSTKMAKIKNMLTEAKYTSILFILGILAIVAIPPSALFVSEYDLFVALINTHVHLAIGIFIALGVIAYAMLKLTVEMVLNKDTETELIKKENEAWNSTHSIIAVHLGLAVFLAFWFTTESALTVVNNIVFNSTFFIQ